MLRALLALIVALALAASASAAPIIVDDFSVGSQQVVGGGPSLTGSFMDVMGVGDIGATRALSYTGTNAATGNLFNDDESLRLNSGLSSSGRLRLATFDSAIQINLVYSNFGTLNASGMTNLDLVFNTIFDKGTNATFDVNVVLTTSTGTLSGVFAAPQGFVPSGGTLSIPLSMLAGSGSLASITQIQINLNDNGSPSAGADFALDAIQFSSPVPEPATLGTFGLVSLLGGYAVRRRMKAASVAQA